MLKDLRYAARSLRRSPGFAITAVLTLALGIGANTAVFSVVHAVLLRALPYPEPSRLVRVGEQGTLDDISIPEYEFWKEHASAFASATAYRGAGDQSIVFDDKRAWIPVVSISTDFFRTLGVNLASGREFHPDETTPTGPRSVILSDNLWREFGSDSQILGRPVTIGDAVYTVVGILPGHFWFPESANAFVPLRPTGSAADEGANTAVIARLKPGISLRQAQAGMAVIANEFRRSNKNRFAGKNYRGLSLVPFQEWLVMDVRLKLLLLFGAVGLLLLIACLNVASLLLARLTARQKEIAVRRALGGNSPRLIRQFAIEHLFLSLIGGFVGLIGAYFLVKGFVSQVPFQLPASAPIRLDWPVLVFTFAVALGTGLIFSTAPVIASTRADIHEVLRLSGQSAGSGSARQQTRSFLVVSEVAFSVILLVSAVLLIQSLYRLHREPLGFSPQGLITFATLPEPGWHESAGPLRNFNDALLERLKTVPDVRSVAAVNVLPLTGQNNFPTQRANHPEQSIGGMEIRVITPAYFETMQIPVIRGRPFADADAAGSLPVILINETVAREWWPQSNPLGDRVIIGRFRNEDLGSDEAREVVGVVADTKSVYLKAPPRPTVYVPLTQNPYDARNMEWVVRTGQVKGLAEQFRQVVAQIDPHQRIQNVRTMQEIVNATAADSRFDAWLFGGFAALALFLTTVGVYGLLSFSVARRTNEIGTRMALGASRANVLKLILSQGITLIVTGLIVGSAGALIVTRSLSTLLFGVRPADPLTYLVVAILLLFVSALASYLPARRAASVDPMAALRCE